MGMGMDVDLRNAAAVCDLFDRAAEATWRTPGRRGSVVDLPGQGSVMLTGDLHDRRDNFLRILKVAGVERSGDRRVVFQEVIHGEHMVCGNDLSYRQLAAIAQLKVERPEQVHQVLSNHEIAQVMGQGILKDGASVTEAFERGLDFVFGEERAGVREAACRYIRSMPLAVRCANGVLCCHSLPGSYGREKFDPAVLERELTDEDLRQGGSAHLMVWGRRLDQSVADELAAAWGVKVFVLGHQHVDMGWEPVGRTMLVLNSDHAHAVALPVELSREYTRDELGEEVLRLNGVML